MLSTEERVKIRKNWEPREQSGVRIVILKTLDDLDKKDRRIRELEDMLQMRIKEVEPDIELDADIEISGRHAQIYQFLKREIELKGYPPSIREIGDAVGLQSTSSVHRYLTELDKKGLIKRDPDKPRAIQIL